MNSRTENPTPAQQGCGPVFRFPDGRGWILFGGLFLLGAAADLWSKEAVFNWLGPAGTGNAYTVIPGLFRIAPCLNDGAAFSILQGQRMILAGVSIAALIVICVLFLMGRIQRRIFQIASGCIAAGIVGNLYDRLFNEGLVRDFLDFYIGSHHWPTFNIADSLLCVGVGLILLANFTSAADRTPDLPQK
jgi:signal peptidase II